jgi:Zn-dependent peptidase ImmA (M78 family)
MYYYLSLFLNRIQCLIEKLMSVDNKKAQKEAEKIWKDFGYVAPPIPILEVAKNSGLRVQEVDFSNHPGVSGILDPDPGKETIYLNQSDSPEQKRFTIAFEIGLWRLHPEAVKKNKNLAIFKPQSFEEKASDKEKEAFHFATHLLVPTNTLDSLKDIYNPEELAIIFAVNLNLIKAR